MHFFQIINSNYLKEEERGDVTDVSFDAADDDFGVEDLVVAEQDPWRVGHHEQTHDCNGDVCHVDFLKGCCCRETGYKKGYFVLYLCVSVGSPLVQEQNSLADSHVQDDEDENGSQTSRGQGMDLQKQLFFQFLPSQFIYWELQ